MKAYKIVELEKGNIKTLFHGINKSRVLEQGKWIKADIKLGRDGKGDCWYMTGWHSLPSIEVAQKYLGNFTNRLDRLRIVECEVKGDIHPKPTNDTVILSEWIKLGNIVEV